MNVTIVGTGNVVRRARQLEQVGVLHIAVQQPLDLGFTSAIKVHS